jgi:hypothetical protein
VKYSLKQFSHWSLNKELTAEASCLGLGPGKVPEYLCIVGERDDFTFGLVAKSEAVFTYEPISINKCPIKKLSIFNT